jgi:hypothetical protein
VKRAQSRPVAELRALRVGCDRDYHACSKPKIHPRSHQSRGPNKSSCEVGEPLLFLRGDNMSQLGRALPRAELPADSCPCRPWVLISWQGAVIKLDSSLATRSAWDAWGPQKDLVR